MTIIIDGTNGISGVDGTAGTPAVQGNDSNTGLLFPAADTVAISTGGTERLRVDSAGNLGLGVTPGAWGSDTKALQIGGRASLSDLQSTTQLTNNGRWTGTGWVYLQTGAAANYNQDSGNHIWRTAPSGTAGNAISFTQAMTLDASGNLGVGTTTLSGYGSNTQKIYQKATGTNPCQIISQSSANDSACAIGHNGTVGIVSSTYGTTGSYTPLAFYTSDTERARITSGGKLLVGTTTDTFAFGNAVFASGGADAGVSIYGTGQTTLAFASATSGAGSYDGYIQYTASTDSMAFATASSERARFAGAYFKASNTGSYIDQLGNNRVNQPYHQFVNTDNSAVVSVFSNNAGSGVLGVFTGLPGSSAGYHFLSELGSSTVYRVLASGNVQNTNNSYGAISDLKLKENITDATPKLAALNQLRVVNYNLKGDSLKQIGLIAQEVEQVFPGLVESTPDTAEVEVTDPDTGETRIERQPNGEVTKAVKYSVLVPMLLKAVQELTAMNDDLRARVAALEGNQP